MKEREQHCIQRTSPLTGQVTTRLIRYDDADYRSWCDGKGIQDAMPYLTAGEREFIKTGYTEEDWKNIFPEEPDGYPFLGDDK